MSEVSKQPKAISWRVVLSVLIVMPFLAASILALGMGNPKAETTLDSLFGALNIEAVTQVEFEALTYNGLVFSRIVIESPSVRKEFLRSLKDFEVARGRAIKPISFELKRDWWDPPTDELGTFWKRGKNMVWNPDSREAYFYVVAEQSSSAGE